MARVIVMAAGDGRRWREAGGVGAKHLLEVDGEPLLQRIVRMAAGHDVIVSGPYPELGVPTFTPSREADIVDGRLAVRELWSATSRTVILLGDTYYTEPAMRTILEHRGPEPCLFARFRGSRITGKPWAEPFANSFLPAHRERHEAALRRAHELHRGGQARRAGLWEAYKLERNARGPFTYATRNLGHAVEIDDWTEDFDYPKDYTEFMRRRERAAA